MGSLQFPGEDGIVIVVSGGLKPFGGSEGCIHSFAVSCTACGFHPFCGGDLSQLMGRRRGFCCIQMPHFGVLVLCLCEMNEKSLLHKSCVLLIAKNTFDTCVA